MRRAMQLLAAAGVVALAGCGRVAHVSGTVVEDGKAYAATDEMVALVFERADPPMKLSVSVQKNGSFVVYGPNNEGLPPGQYKVGYYSDIEGGRRKRLKDLTPAKSPLVLDLGSGDRAKITVDLVKGTLTRQ